MADYLLKSVLHITPLKKGTISVFTLHFLFVNKKNFWLLSQKLGKKLSSLYSLLYYFKINQVWLCICYWEQQQQQQQILFQYSATITVPGKKFFASWFCNPKPWLWDARYKNSASLFRAQSTQTFCCYNHQVAIHSPGMWERLMLNHTWKSDLSPICATHAQRHNKIRQKEHHTSATRDFMMNSTVTPRSASFSSHKQLITLYQKLRACKYIRIPWYINHDRHKKILGTYLWTPLSSQCHLKSEWHPFMLQVYVKRLHKIQPFWFQ